MVLQTKNLIDFVINSSLEIDSILDEQGIPDFIYQALKLEKEHKIHNAIDALYRNILPMLKCAKNGEELKWNVLEKITEYAIYCDSLHLKVTCLTLLSKSFTNNRQIKHYNQLLDTVIELENQIPGISYGFKKY